MHCSLWMFTWHTGNLHCSYPFAVHESSLSLPRQSAALCRQASRARWQRHNRQAWTFEINLKIQYPTSHKPKYCLAHYGLAYGLWGVLLGIASGCSFMCATAVSLTYSAAPDTNLLQRSALFSGHTDRTASTLSDKRPILLLQVRNCLCENAKKDNNRCLLLLPCPQVFFVLTECANNCLLLLMSGDVEENPGLLTRNAVRHNIASVTNNSLIR